MESAADPLSLRVEHVDREHLFTVYEVVGDPDHKVIGVIVTWIAWYERFARVPTAAFEGAIDGERARALARAVLTGRGCPDAAIEHLEADRVFVRRSPP